jgi:beta-lactamase regulating signal transducer with metallopeptidase domain
MYLFDYFKEQLFFSAIVFIIVFILTLFLKKKNIIIIYGLWLLILLRLILPPDFSLPFSAVNIIKQVSPEFEPVKMIHPDRNEINAGDIHHPPESPLSSHIIRNRIIFCLYITGFFIFLFIYIRRILFYRYLKGKALPVDNDDLVFLLDKWKKQFKIKKNIELRSTSDNISPFVIGYFKPVIIIPDSIIEQQDQKILETIIAHEIAHIKCCDTFWVKIQYIISILYFFHPLVWYINNRINQIREYFCDAMVVSKNVIPPSVYAKSLLEIMRQNQFKNYEPIPVPVLKHEKRRLKTRIENIIGGKNMFNNKYVFISVCCIIILGIIILPLAGSHLFARDNPGTDGSSALCGPGFRIPLMNQYWKGKISSRFGERTNPFTGKKDFHNGIDIPLTTGTPVLAAADGSVLEICNMVDNNKGPGKYIILQHQGGFETRYNKLDRIICMGDQVVKSGDVIGYSGNTGLSTGPHLHFELRKDGKPVNPESCISFE